MERLWKRIISVGLAGAPPSQAKYIVLLNSLAFIGGLLALGYLVILSLYLPEALALLKVTLTGTCLCFSALLINALGFQLVAKLAFNLSALLTYVIMALLSGAQSNIHLHIILVIVASFFIYAPHEGRSKCFIIVLSVFSFLGLEWWFSGHSAVMALSDSLLRVVKAAVNFGLAVYILGFSYYIYTVNFEAERSLESERARAEGLLLNILPEEIAVRLKTSPGTIAEAFQESTVLFADIVGFTGMTERMAPESLVRLLNEIFSRFDDLADKHGLEKIKTVGDAYMAAAGIPIGRADHAEAVAEFALDMLDSVKDVTDDNGNNLMMRIGISSGPIVAGVIGKKKFAYDMWGDSVNTASRMEFHGIPGAIQVCPETYERLKAKYSFQRREEIHVKGKGLMRAYILMRG